MLSDERRIKRCRDAIDPVIRPGVVVADFGTGLGGPAVMPAKHFGIKLPSVPDRGAARIPPR